MANREGSRRRRETISMRIRVQSVTRQPDLITVIFSCAYGGGIAKWLGRIPAANREYDVEFTIRDIHSWRLLPELEGKASVESLAGFTQLRGRVEVCNDGFASIRLGDSIVLAGFAPAEVKHGAHVEIMSRCPAELVPFDL
jgi:hypothetical protein